MKYQYSYLVKIQYLGFRFHGWQKQKNVKTIHDIVDKTLSFVFDIGSRYKTLGSGRTDAKVSASTYAFQLFFDEEIIFDEFIENFNLNAPSDVRGISIIKTAIDFNIIKASKVKEYHYYFSFGEKNHPFAAPFIVGVNETLNIEAMMAGAKLFEGEHYFHKYCTKPSKKTSLKRSIDSCEIIENTNLTANFFPNKSYVLKVKSKGFLRYQIRLMMAVLFELGKENLALDFIRVSLREDNDKKFLRNIAPASGLQLFDIEFDL